MQSAAVRAAHTTIAAVQCVRCTPTTTAAATYDDESRTAVAVHSRVTTTTAAAAVMDSRAAATANLDRQNFIGSYRHFDRIECAAAAIAAGCG